MMGQKGFSLVELMVVVAIIGIGAAIAAPNISGMVDNERTRETAEKFHVMVKEAQLDAKKTGRINFIKSNAAGSLTTLISRYRDSNNNNQYDNNDELLDEIELPPSVKIGPSKGYNANLEYGFIQPTTPCSFCVLNTAIGIDEAGQLFTVNNAGLTKIDAIYINFVPSYDFEKVDSENVRLVTVTSTGMVKTWTK